ncbi:shootin-1-like [Apteryx mantelli]|uniref:Shootin-1-like n=1 Tax=Apteryx mantelli TaxID=2696672 RepID=A0ABM4EKY6_9AVES
MDWAGESVRPLAAILESEGNEAEEEEEEEEDEEAEEEEHLTLIQEMDEAKEKLSEFEQASQALLAELSALETQFEIEKTCRQQAEAYAAQVNQENAKLKRLSLMLPPEEAAGEQDPGPDPAWHYGQQLRDLQERLSRLLAEKKDLAAEVRELQSHNRELQEQLERENGEKQTLRATLDRNQRALKSFKRAESPLSPSPPAASQIVTQDYREAVQQLELEQELRLHAEAFAHQMLVEKKEANRQSSILMQSVGPNAQLLRALEDVGNLTRLLEEAKQEHQRQVKTLEEQLETRPEREELDAARAALAAAEEENGRLRRRLHEAQKQLAELEQKVRALEETLPSRTDPLEPAVPPPPPPPPPPLPPPGPAVPVDPLSAIRQRKGLANGKRGKPDADDVKARAVQEMMDRIKSGVVLRPAKERAPPGQVRRSAAMELRSILGTMRKTSRTPSWRKSSVKGRDSQLDSILQRRRKALDSSASTPASLPGSEPAAAAAGSPAQAPGDGAVRAAPSTRSSQENGDAVRFRPRSAGSLPKNRPTVRLVEGRFKPA